MSTLPANPSATRAGHSRQPFTGPALPSQEAPSMTTTTLSPVRADTAALLRAVADLIETRPDIPGPSTRVHFVVIGADAAATVAAIAAALPCPWHAEIARNATLGNDWLRLEARAGDAEVSVSAEADAVCTATGTATRTVPATVWEPQSAIAAVVGDALTGGQR
jgi:hypothetical protein